MVYPYCQVTCNHILQLVSEGKSINAISEIDGFPPAHTIWQWLREHPEFRAQMKIARECRAEFFEGKLIDLAEEVDEGNVQAARVKADIWKWTAKVGNPEVYGDKTKISGDSRAPLQFIISTGFPSPNEHQRPPELNSDGTIKIAAQQQDMQNQSD